MSFKSKWAIIACAVTLFNVLGSSSVSGDTITTPDQALERAIQITGFEVADSVPAEHIARQIILESDNIPLIEDSIINRKVWIVDMGQVRLELGSFVPSYNENQILKRYSVYIDAASGALLKVVGKQNRDDGFFFDEFSIEALKKVLVADKWLSLSDSLPKIPFTEALNQAIGSNPLKAKQIYAVCIMFSSMNKEPRKVWIVIGSGIPKTSLIRSGRVSTIIDADSGHRIAITNVP